MIADEFPPRYDGTVPARKHDSKVGRAFGRVLKLARTEAELGRQELADRAGLRRADEIGRFERGERVPDLGTFLAIARALGISENRLLVATVEKMGERGPDSEAMEEERGR